MSERRQQLLSSVCLVLAGVILLGLGWGGRGGPPAWSWIQGLCGVAVIAVFGLRAVRLYRDGDGR